MKAKSLDQGGLLDKILKRWLRSPFWRLVFPIPGVALVLFGVFAVGSPILVILGILVALAPPLMATTAEFLDKHKANQAAIDRAFEPLRKTRPSSADGLSLMLPRYAGPLFFYSRHDEQRRLDVWLSSSCPVMILDGGPLTGKARLAVEWGDSLGTPWFVGWLRPGQGKQALGTIRACRADTLIILEGPSEDLLDLLSELADHEKPQVKVLVIARSGTDIHEFVGRRGGRYAKSLLGDLPSIRVDILGQLDDRQRWFEELCRYYADALSEPAPLSDATFVRSLGPVPIGFLHVAALAAARTGKVPAGQLDLGGLMSELWKSEVSGWEKSRISPRWGIANIGEAQLEKAVLALTLLEGIATDADSVSEVLRKIPDLSEMDSGTRRNIIAWARNTYPADAMTHQLGFGLRPRVLADAALVHATENDKAFGCALFRALPESNAREAIHRLIDATGLFPKAATLLAELIVDHPDRIQSAIQYAAGTVPVAADLDKQLASRLTECRPSIELTAHLLRVVGDGPLPRVLIALTRLRVAQLQDRSTQSPGSNESELAAALHDQSKALRAAGGATHEAIQASDKALKLYRRLSRNNPALHEANLARTLSDRSALLHDAGGHQAEELRSGKEAAAIYRRLAKDNPGQYETYLAVALAGHAVSMLEAGGRTAEGLQTNEEAIMLFRRPACDGAEQHEPYLAGALVVQSWFLLESGTSASEALDFLEEAVSLHRDLVKDHALKHEPDLAHALTIQAMIVLESGTSASKARDIIDEAIAILRRLAKNNPAKHEPDLAGGLANRTLILREIAGRITDAVQSGEEAITLYRRLAKKYPAKHEPQLASTLANQGLLRLETGRVPSESLLPVEAAVAIYRRLAKVNPTQYEPYLASTLATLALVMKHSGKPPTETLGVAGEAIALYQCRPQDNPALRPEGHALALKLRGFSLIDIGSTTEAILPLKEALSIFERLAHKNPSRWLEKFASESRETQRKLEEAGLPPFIMARKTGTDDDEV